MSWQRFMAVLIARNYEFLRDRSALGWNILLPLLIVFGFAFGFADDQLDRYKVGLIEGDGMDAGFLQTRHVRFIPVEDRAQAITRVERHQLDMLLDMEQKAFWVNETSANGYVLEQLLLASDRAFSKQLVSGRQIRYVDWLIPGVLGMNMMFSALYGVGYVIVRYRKNGVLKRLKATPLSAFEFLSAQLISRWWLIMVISIAVYFGTHYVVGFPMHGRYLDLFLVFGLGAFSMICMGLIVAARIRSEELADGILNLISWPMMFLSGVWFSLDGLHPWVQKLAMIFPLAHITEAARAIMIDGVGLGGVAIHLAILAAMSLLFLILGALSFRWE